MSFWQPDSPSLAGVKQHRQYRGLILLYLLFIQALQLLPNILVSGVEGSVDFLQRGQPKTIYYCKDYYLTYDNWSKKQPGKG